MSPARRTFNLAPTPATDRADDWRDDAACLDVDPELFFTGGYPSAWGKHPEDAARAKAICADCPVVAECLTHAYEVGDGHSIRGGLTPSQRDRLRRKAKRKEAQAS
ncbi:MAG TPA: WhiB family transcriptional regulator [Intrasporangium sp.]|jgi:Transcription factor WhiB.|uniref:WhiB family transcriptional regulator n=1 Tax=Intrasporangium sp. TaxID=1925024 RepID=UPI002F939BE7